MKGTTTISWAFDPLRRQITFDDDSVSLTAYEASVVEYLLARRGQIIPRQELETEVWGMAPGVQSETVPVTLRKIRAKLGPDRRHILQVLRGRGYRILGFGADPTLPDFGTPFFTRTVDQHAIQRLFDDGWRVVTLVGPGGIGKTRLAVEVARSLPSTVFVSIGDARTVAEVVLRVSSVIGLAISGLSELEQALDHQRPVIVFDEAEGCLEAVGEVVERLGNLRFLVTSRRDLGRVDEAVHPVRPLTGDEGRAFARATIRASRWGDDPAEDKTLDRLLLLVDGLPLAIEVAASQPLHPRQVVAELDGGDHLFGEDRLFGALTGSYDHLDTEHREVLRGLAVPDGPLARDAIVDWLGPDALDRVEELGRRSLLSREGQSWRVLRTMRRFVRARDPDWDARCTAFDAWLFRRATLFTEQIWSSPEQALAATWPLLDYLLLALKRSHSQDVSDPLWTLALTASLRGPLQLCARAIQLTTTTAPNDPLVALFSVCSPGAVDTRGLPNALSRTTNEVRFRVALLFVFSWLPTELDIAQLLPVEPEHPRHRWMLELVQLKVTGNVAGLRKRVAQLPRDGLQNLLTSVALAQVLSQQQSGTAERQWTQLIEATEGSLMGNIHQLVLTGLADARLEGDRSFALAAYADVATRSIRRGLGNSWAVARCGLWTMLLDGEGSSRPMLEHGTRSPHARVRNLSLALLQLLDHRHDRSSPLHPPAGIAGVLVDGTSLADLVAALFELEGLNEGEDPSEQAAWINAPDTVAFRLWKTLETRRSR